MLAGVVNCNGPNNSCLVTFGVSEPIVSSVTFSCTAFISEKEIDDGIKNLISISGFYRELIAYKRAPIRIGYYLARKTSCGMYNDTAASFLQFCLDNFRCFCAIVVYNHVAHIDFLKRTFIRFFFVYAERMKKVIELFLCARI